MTKTKVAFTLVELIVVITILAILGTLAFISFQSYAQEAKNSKVLSDIRTIVSAVETASTKGDSFMMVDFVDTSSAYGSEVTSGTFLDWEDITTAEYAVWKINFPFLKQSQTDFLDPEWNDYIAASIYESVEPEDVFYQIVGQTKNSAWGYDAIVKGTYLKTGSWDIDGLIAAPGYANWVTGLSINMATPGVY